MIKEIVRSVFMAWSVLFFVSLVTNGLILYEKYKHQWQKDVELYHSCHDIDYMKRNSNDCAYIFNNAPWGIRYCFEFIRDTILAADKCGVPCSDIFTFSNIIKFGALKWIADLKEVPRWLGVAKKKYMDYKMLQLRKNN
jgi:hypothetical protein